MSCLSCSSSYKLFESDLRVSQVRSLEGLRVVQKIVTIWKSEADSINRRFGKGSWEFQKMEDCSTACFLMTSNLDGFLERGLVLLPDAFLFYVCEDRQGNLLSVGQGVSSPSKIGLNVLVSNPSNLLPSQDGKRIKGASRAIVFEMIKKAISLQIESIFLTSMLSAEGFYMSIGFEKKNPDSSEMVLTAEKIWHLYPHFIIPGLSVSSLDS